MDQYMRWKGIVQPEILAVEEPVENYLWKYRGTLDRRLKINGNEGILDIKGVSRAPWHGLQLAAYAGCFNRPMRRWNLYLDGKREIPMLIEQTRRDDWETFIACLRIRSHVEGRNA